MHWDMLLCKFLKNLLPITSVTLQDTFIIPTRENNTQGDINELFFFLHVPLKILVGNTRLILYVTESTEGS